MCASTLQQILTAPDGAQNYFMSTFRIEWNCISVKFKISALRVLRSTCFSSESAKTKTLWQWALHGDSVTKPTLQQRCSEARVGHQFQRPNNEIQLSSNTEYSNGYNTEISLVKYNALVRQDFKFPVLCSTCK